MGSDQVISIPAEPAEADRLPPMLKDFKACPPFVTDIDLSVDDKYLYVSCWGTGDFHQYDVSDPFKPKLTGKLRIGGICSRAAHPKGNGPLNGGPQFDAKLNGVAAWTIHDLRRTARSLMARAGTLNEIAERVLGHAIGGVHGIYNRHEYREEKA